MYKHLIMVIFNIIFIINILTTQVGRNTALKQTFMWANLKVEPLCVSCPYEQLTFYGAL